MMSPLVLTHPCDSTHGRPGPCLHWHEVLVAEELRRCGPMMCFHPLALKALLFSGLISGERCRQLCSKLFRHGVAASCGTVRLAPHATCVAHSRESTNRSNVVSTRISTPVRYGWHLLRVTDDPTSRLDPSVNPAPHGPMAGLMADIRPSMTPFPQGGWAVIASTAVQPKLQMSAWPERQGWSSQQFRHSKGLGKVTPFFHSLPSPK